MGKIKVEVDVDVEGKPDLDKATASLKNMDGAGENLGLELASLKQKSTLLKGEMRALSRSVADGSTSVEDAASDYNKLEKELKDVDRQAEKTKSELSGMDESAGRTGVSFGNLKTAASGLGVGLVAAGAVFKTFKSEILDAGAEVEVAQNTFTNLTASIGTTSEAMLSQLRPATRGMVSDFDLMRANSRFLSMGLADNASEAAKLSEVATQLGSAMGKDAGAAMEEFALLLANQSIPRLDTFGISAGKVRERIKELTTGTDALDRETAFMVATMEQAELTMARVGEQGDTTAAGMARLSAEMSNFADEKKQAIAKRWDPIFTGLANVIDTVRGRNEKLNNAVADGFITQEDYNRAVRDGIIAGKGLIVAQNEAIEGYVNYDRSVATTTFNATSLTEELKLLTAATVEQDEVVMELTDRDVLFATVTANLNDLINSEEANVRRLNNAFGGTVEQTEAAEVAVSKLFDGIAGLPDSKSISIDLSVTGFNAIAAFLGGGGQFGEFDFDPEVGDIQTAGELAAQDAFDPGGGGVTVNNNFNNADNPAQIAGQIASQIGNNLN